MRHYLLTLIILLFSYSMNLATTHTIQFGGVNGFSYNPSNLTVQPGDEIIWQGDFSFHPLVSTAVPNGAASFTNTTGNSFSYIPTVPGTYNFKCNNHGGSGMTGTFTVENPTGVIKPLQVQKSIRIFPTRTEGDITIDPGYFARKNSNLTLDIYNALGQKLQTLSIPGEEISNIRLQGLNKGIYLLSVKRNEEVLQVTRIIKE